MTRSFARLRARSLCFLLFSLSLFPFPFAPHLLLYTMLRVPHPIVIHTWPFVLARSLTKMNCIASKPTASIFSYSSCLFCACNFYVHAHTLAFSAVFFLSLSLSLSRLSFFLFSVDECLEDIVFQACSYRHRREMLVRAQKIEKERRKTGEYIK